MALVVKSWKVTSNAAPGEPHVVIVARKPGLMSFILSLLGIDATASFQVSARHIFYEVGSLAGFIRRFTPLEQVSSTYYGLFKPWKTTTVFIAISLMLGLTLIKAGGTGMVVFGTLVLFGGVGLSLLYYFLNKQLSIGFVEVSGFTAGLVFKRSVIEGQQIDEQATESVIRIIEHLVKPTGAPLPAANIGSAPKSGAMAAPAPQNLSELGRNLGMGKPAAPLRCAKCGASLTSSAAFCDGCGAKAPMAG